MSLLSLLTNWMHLCWIKVSLFKTYSPQTVYSQYLNIDNNDNNINYWCWTQCQQYLKYTVKPSWIH